METKTPWKTLAELNYLSAETFLPGEQRVLTIKDVRQEALDNHRGTITNKWVLYFEEDSLPMVLNSTNCETISKIYGTVYVEDWIGKRIQIYAPTISAFGETKPALRIRKVIPESTEPVYKCCVCGKTISKEIHEGSIQRYGKPYCSGKCHDEDVKGKDL